MLNRLALYIIISSTLLLIVTTVSADTKTISKSGSIQATATVINPAGITTLPRRPAQNLATSESNMMHLKLAESLAFNLPKGSSMILNLKTDRFQTQTILSQLNQPGKLNIKYEEGRAIILINDIRAALPLETSELVVTVIPADI